MLAHLLRREELPHGDLGGRGDRARPEYEAVPVLGPVLAVGAAGGAQRPAANQLAVPGVRDHLGSDAGRLLFRLVGPADRVPMREGEERRRRRLHRPSRRRFRDQDDDDADGLCLPRAVE